MIFNQKIPGITENWHKMHKKSDETDDFCFQHIQDYPQIPTIPLGRNANELRASLHPIRNRQ